MTAGADEVGAAVRSIARSLGFDRVGVARIEPLDEYAHYERWLDAGHAGAMSYLARTPERRRDPRVIDSRLRSAIVVAVAYGPRHSGRAAGEAPSAGRARVSRYAGGDDYHEVLLDRLEALATAVEVHAGRPLASRCYVDTGPVLERSWAARAGLGWLGKNTCLIDPELGSYLFLGVLFSELDLVPDVPIADHCGSCTACLEACPTEAFVSPGVLDARRCIAYTTIEDPGPVAESLREAHGAWLFGCDVCQEVCPWNSRRGLPVLRDPLGLRERLSPGPAWREPDLAWLLSLDEEQWRELTRHSALRRAKYRGLMRNALVAAGNAGDPALAPAVRRFAQGEDELLAEHARWALARLAASPP